MRLDAPSAIANGELTSRAKADFLQLQTDGVADAVLDYGKLESKIGSLAQLRALPGARSEIAMLSLGRAYVNRCIRRGGKWTSGVHLVMWTRRRLLDEPVVAVGDIRGESSLPLARQVELAQWTLVMFRLIFISDVGHYAPAGDRTRSLASFAETAAAATHDLSPGKLLNWLKRKGTKLFDAALSEARYDKLAEQLRVEHPE